MNRGGVFRFEPSADSGLPLYRQLAHALADAIHAGFYQPDEALPSERVLAEQLGVSRVTSRSAIAQLVEQGLIVRRSGSGSYIAPRAEQVQSRMIDFSQQLHPRGYTPSSRWLDRSIAVAMADEQLSLGLAPGARVARLERLRMADDCVVAYEVSVFPQSVVPDPAAFEGSPHEHLDRMQLAPVRALQHIRAFNAQPQLAVRLGVPDRHAVLLITRIGYLGSGLAVELTHAYCRSDYYEFVAETRRLG